MAFWVLGGAAGAVGEHLDLDNDNSLKLGDRNPSSSPCHYHSYRDFAVAAAAHKRSLAASQAHGPPAKRARRLLEPKGLAFVVIREGGQEQQPNHHHSQNQQHDSHQHSSHGLPAFIQLFPPPAGQDYPVRPLTPSDRPALPVALERHRHDHHHHLTRPRSSPVLGRLSNTHYPYDCASRPVGPDININNTPAPAHAPSPPASAPPMERTESGLSISSPADCAAHLRDLHSHDVDAAEDRLSDQEAADLVRAHVHSLHRDSQPARILRSLIHPRHLSTSTSSSSSFSTSTGSPCCCSDHHPYQIQDDGLDDAALHSLFGAANALFFANRLSRRVRWDWSASASSTSSSAHSSFSSNSSSAHPSTSSPSYPSAPASPAAPPTPPVNPYEAHIVGTTALRRSTTETGGWETLIVLSAPILRDARYCRRLLIAAFLHEMIHSFLFVTCGLGHAAAAGGHTPGFRAIADTIDAWVGRDLLRLGDVEADLERFRR